jgi:hypothetical protein
MEAEVARVQEAANRRAVVSSIPVEAQCQAAASAAPGGRFGGGGGGGGRF